MEAGEGAGRSRQPAGTIATGDLLQPRGIRSGTLRRGSGYAGGRIIRTDINGSVVETFAGGSAIPTAAFNSAGELFTHDSDMLEWDVAALYRLTAVCWHAVPAADGWRMLLAAHKLLFTTACHDVINDAGARFADWVYRRVQ